jgi:hypothetical protein
MPSSCRSESSGLNAVSGATKFLLDNGPEMLANAVVIHMIVLTQYFSLDIS